MRSGLALDMRRCSANMTAPLSDDGVSADRAAAFSTASITYGLLYGLTFALTVWGFDGWALAASNSESAALKLLVGLPGLVLLGFAAGFALRRRPSHASWVLIWMVTGALSGLLVGIIPHLGQTVAAWVLVPGLRGIAVHPVPAALWTRAVFFAALTAGAGTVVGLVGRQAVERASRKAAPSGRLKLGSMAGLLVCVPLAALPALAGDELINRGLRAGQRAAARELRDLTSDAYVLHRVSGWPEIWDETIDVAFPDGFVMRCSVRREFLVDCLAVSPSYRAWMETLIEGAPGDAETVDAIRYAGGLSVGDGVLADLARSAGRIDDAYEIQRQGQYGDWVVMSARFDRGAILTCYFHSHDPVVLNHCRLS